MKKLSLLSLLVITISANAQFVIDNSDSPAIGERYAFQKADTTGVQPGNAGNGITWDFSSLVALNDSNVQVFVTPASTPYASDFPDANQAQTGDGNYNYFKAAGDGYYYYGAVTSDGQGGVVKYKYTDAAKYYKYPYNYGETFTDNLAAGYVSGGITFSRTGTFTGTYDGYGTLKLPGGTFQKVARVKLLEANNDVASVGGFTINIKTTITTYIWRQENRKEPLLLVSFVKTESAQVNTLDKVVQFSRAQSSGVGMEELFANEDVLLYPNPAAGKAELTAAKGLASVIITDLNGREKVNTAANGLHITLDLSLLEKGVYMVQATMEDRSIVIRKLAVY
jgi:hypothetical protein